MGIVADIEKALLDAAIAFADDAALSYEVPNRKLDPKPETGAYLVVTHFRNTNQNLAWGDGTLIQGILQISVYYPVDQGSLPITRIAESIVEAFDKGTVLIEGVATVRITQKPSVLTPVEAGQETFMPVSIPYQCSQF